MDFENSQESEWKGILKSRVISKEANVIEKERESLSSHNATNYNSKTKRDKFQAYSFPF